jgi:hypothetical protein
VKVNENLTQISLPIREGVNQRFYLDKEPEQDYQPEGLNGD